MRARARVRLGTFDFEPFIRRRGAPVWIAFPPLIFWDGLSVPQYRVLVCAPLRTRVQPGRVQPPAAVELQWKGSVWRGVVADALGVLKSDAGDTYAGGVSGGVPDGRAMIKWSDGRTEYFELAAGERHGYREVHYSHGDVWYFVHERGKTVHSARVDADGRCDYDNEYNVGADHAGLVALKAAAQQATVRLPPKPRRSPSIRAAVGLCARLARARARRCAFLCVGLH
jgi:hypothetical protein